MGKYIDESQYTILDEIIERHNEEHEKKPRIDCLRHGRTLICAGWEVKPEALEQILDDLEKLRAIEVKEDDGSIWKNEYLVIKSSAGN